MALSLKQGSSGSFQVQWMTSKLNYLTGVTLQATAPMTLTKTNHGIPDGWWVAVNNATGGFSGLNAGAQPPDVSEDLRKVTVVDTDTLQFNAVNAVGLKASQAATLVYYAPLDITGCSARAQLRKKISGPVIHEFLSPTDITINYAGSATTLLIPAELSAQLTAGSYVLDLELAFSNGDVKSTQVLELEITPEVTRG